MTVTSGEARLRKEISNVDLKIEEVKKTVKKYDNINMNNLMQTMSQNIISFLAIGRDKFVELLKNEFTTLEAKVLLKLVFLINLTLNCRYEKFAPTCGKGR